MHGIFTSCTYWFKLSHTFVPLKWTMRCLLHDVRPTIVLLLCHCCTFHVIHLRHSLPSTYGSLGISFPFIYVCILFGIDAPSSLYCWKTLYMSLDSLVVPAVTFTACSIMTWLCVVSPYMDWYLNFLMHLLINMVLLLLGPYSLGYFIIVLLSVVRQNTYGPLYEFAICWNILY